MADCKMLGGCIFFNKTSGQLAETMKSQYCKGDFSKCARYMVATTLGREKVPQTLFPNMQSKAQEIIKNG